MTNDAALAEDRPRQKLDNRGAPCRACAGAFTVFVRDVPMRRLPRSAPLYACLECQTLQTPQIYVEDDARHAVEPAWHVTVEERNTKWAFNFFQAALAKRPSIASVLEIGCATGTFLAEGNRRGLRVAGYDTNRHCAPVALERHGIAVKPEMWDANSEREPFDLICCISTLEHVTDPLALLREIGVAAKRWGAGVFVSVPFELEAGLAFIDQPNDVATNPFYHIDVHINHFSRRGFEKMAALAGAQTVEYFPRGWIGYWLEF